jgi:hypothetical protein
VLTRSAAREVSEVVPKASHTASHRFDPCQRIAPGRNVSIMTGNEQNKNKNFQGNQSDKDELARKAGESDTQGNRGSQGNMQRQGGSVQGNMGGSQGGNVQGGQRSGGNYQSGQQGGSQGSQQGGQKPGVQGTPSGQNLNKGQQKTGSQSSGLDETEDES